MNKKIWWFVSVLFVFCLSVVSGHALTVWFKVDPTTQRSVTKLNIHTSSSSTTPKPWTIKDTRIAPFNNLTSIKGTNYTGNTYAYATFGNNSSVTSDPSNVVMIPKFDPILSWPTPSPISADTPLSTVQLNAVAKDSLGNNLPGTFVYSPSIGTILSSGNRTLTAIFTPTDTANINGGVISVAILVNPPTAPVLQIRSVTP